MQGPTIHAKAAPPWGGFLFLFLAGGLLVAAVVEKNPHFAIFAILPFLGGLALIWRRPREFAAQLTADAIEVTEPAKVVIPYETLDGLRGPLTADPSRFKPFPITLFHKNGVLRIPKNTDPPSREIYDFLYQLFPSTGGRDVNPLLAEIFQHQAQTFGPDKVFSYRARTHYDQGRENRAARAFWLGALLTCLIWMVLGVVLSIDQKDKDAVAWVGAGFIGGFVSLLLWLTLWTGSRPKPSVKNWKDASLIVSPMGIALTQGTTQGEMKWDELRGVKMNLKQTSNNNAWIGFLLFGYVGYAIMNRHGYGDAAKRGIILKFEGGEVRIADYYDRPLPMIMERIKQYWGK